MTPVSRRRRPVVKTAELRTVAAAPRKRERNIVSAQTVRRKRISKFLPDEIARKDNWFADYIRGLDSDIAAIDASMDDAHPDDKEDLRSLRTDLVGKKTRAVQQENAFQAEDIPLLPPSDDDIRKTQALTARMDALIRATRRAQAVVTLVSDLADLATKIGV